MMEEKDLPQLFKGTRVQITLTLDEDFETADDAIYYRGGHVYLDAIEDIEVIEPEWQDGDIVADGNDALWEHKPQDYPSKLHWQRLGGGGWTPTPSAPLRLIGRNGKVV